MAIVNQGLTIFRDACKAECVNGEAGTGTGTPASTQTGLEAGVSATNAALSITNGTYAWQTSHFIGSATGTGNTYAEWSIEDASNQMISRAVTAGVTHGDTDEITKVTTFNLVDR